MRLSVTALLLAVAIHLLPTIAAAESVSESAGKILIDWDPSIINFSPDCAKSYWRGRGNLCILEMVSDSGGDVHIFLVNRAPNRNLISHYKISKGELQQLDSILITHGEVVALRAAAGPSGEIYLLKAETLDRIYLQTFAKDRWGAEQGVLDEKAQPFLMDSSDLGLSVSHHGSIDVFWTDTREYHFLADILSMGHSGNYEKTYHRRLSSSGWSEAEQVQARGYKSIPYRFQPMPSSDSSVDLLWSMSSSSSGAMLVRSTLGKKGWSEKETVGECRSSFPDPSIDQMEMLDGNPESPKVAWSCYRDEYTEPGTRKNDSFSNLYVSARNGGTWRTGPQLTRNVSEFRWVGRGEKALLLLQETSGHGPERKRNVPLLALEIEGNKPISRVPIAGHTVEGFLESATASDGTFHIIYAVPTSDTEATLVYRSGRLLHN
jgi:hypothetical protein